MQKVKQAHYHYYQTFLDSLTNSPETKTKYKYEFNMYLDWLKVKDPDRLITPVLLDSPAEIRKVEDSLIKYLKYLNQVKKLSYNTTNVRMAAIFHFYTINRVHIDRKYISKFKPAHRKIRKGDLSYTHDQINTLVDKANTRDKMIVLLMASTGMRIGALCKLTIGSSHKISVKGYSQHIYKIIVYEGEPEEYYTFTTFECAVAIDDYLREREHFGEQLTNDSPLIRNEYTKFRITGPQRASNPEYITTRGIKHMFERLLIKTRLRTRAATNRNLHNVMMSHGFRKFAITQMIKAKVDYQAREYLVGHRHSRGLDVNYDRTSDEDRLNEYLKAMDLLTISPENRLRRQVQEQDHTIQVRMTEKDRQIEQLTQRQDQLEAWLRNPEQFIKMRDEAIAMGQKEK